MVPQYQNKMSQGLLGNSYYEICDDNSDYYIVIRVGFDPMTRKMRPMISNPVYGDPPPGMDRIEKNTLRLLRTGKLKGIH